VGKMSGTIGLSMLSWSLSDMVSVTPGWPKQMHLKTRGADMSRSSGSN
jgi:hypothetical protein